MKTNVEALAALKSAAWEEDYIRFTSIMIEIDENHRDCLHLMLAGMNGLDVDALHEKLIRYADQMVLRSSKMTGDFSSKLKEFCDQIRQGENI